MTRATKRLLVTAMASSTMVIGGFGVATQQVVAVGAACNPTSSVDGDYSVLTFTTPGSCSWTPPAGLSLVDVLAVGGGGGGGGGKRPGSGGTFAGTAAGGGGGGGHVTYATSTTVSGPVDVVIGAGGSGGQASRDQFLDNSSTPGATGGTSSFGDLTAPGGGGGGGLWNTTQDRLSGDGGASGENASGTITSTSGGLSIWDAGGGGAGAGGNGSSGTDLPSNGAIGGAGGVGVASSITGSSVTYGGGGGGGGAWDGTGSTAADGSGGTGGTGGGGDGSQLPSTIAASGVDGRGGGGGGGGYTAAGISAAGADGGDGVVIVRYLTTARNLVVTTSPGNTTVGGSLVPPVVQVQDGTGGDVALAGVAVSASLTTGSGTLSNAVAVTDASGAASFTSFGLDGAAGNYVVEFSARLLSAATTPIRIDQPAPPNTGGGTPQAPETPQPTPSPPRETVASVPAATPPAPTPLPPGTSTAVIGGAPVVVTEEAAPGERVVVITAGPVEMSLSSTTSTGQAVPLAADGSLLLPRTGDLPMSVSGLAPGSLVTKTLFSDPINLGTGTVDAAGNFSSTASIPATVPLGSHTLRVQGTTNTNDPFTLDVGVTVATPAVALGARPVLTVQPIKDSGLREIYATMRGVQRGCLVTFQAGNVTAKARASTTGRASVTIRLPRAVKASPRVTARVSGSGCAPVTASS